MMDRMPQELLLLIGKHIQGSSDSQNTLYSLTLCCRHFHDVFQPMIYHSLSISSFSVGFARLIMRLWRRPDLASQVRRLEMCWSDCSDCDQDSADKLSEDPEVVRFIEEALNEIFTPEEEDTRSIWEQHLDTEFLCAEAWLGLLLVRANQLQTIEFGHEHSELMSNILHKAANRQYPFHRAPPFPYLEEVQACVAWGAAWIDSGFLTPFFYFPAIRTIYGSAIGERRDDENMTLDKSYISSPVREIIVDEAYWCRGMLDWLMVCTKLEHVSINIEVQADEYEISDHEKFDASLFRTMLLPSAKTLKTLRVCYGEWYRDKLEEHDADDAPFGTFRDFVVMEDISVRHSHLIGRISPDSTDHWDTKPLVDILPFTLQRFEIIDLMESHQLQLLSQLSELVRRGCCQNLERVEFHLDLEDSDAPIDALNSLKLECDARGIDLEVKAQEDS
ncbi:hypothetical protein N7481_010418 [Penicillium waksmanii]|uniref:uncharacterized protein n=1 Tax=Penicillium waksmanii TaxID=69791 RepID=UPI002547E592|nr:uncharacterized protein N7481_010418 [Penicillium waksmanii]KAJ5973208.1 hypothetical protein N7481_010418 [Penicillium waksmanii]